LFEKTIDFIKKVVRRLFPIASLEKAFNVEINADSLMMTNINLWANMYEDKPPWLSDTVSSMGLPASVANELARLVTLEVDSKITGDGARAKYLEEQYRPVIDSIRRYTEYACAKGGLVFKPYVDGNRIIVDYIQADNFYPVDFGSNGEITTAIFVEQKTVGDNYYTRLEYHSFNGTQEIIKNRAYMSSVKESLGKEVSLNTVDTWKDLQEEAVVNGINKPLFAYFKIPMANNVDTYSPLGVSVFSRAVDLIKEADKQYSRTLWEYEGSELAVHVDITAFKRDKDGNSILPSGKERLYKMLDVESKDAFYNVFSPAIRNESHHTQLNKLLRNIEFNCGLAYGTLSDPESVALTATEVKQSKQRSYSTVTDIQKALQEALEHLVYIMDTYATIYKLAPSGSYEVSFTWDDSIVIDAESERARDLQEIRDGIMSKVEYRMKWYGEDEKTATEKVAKVKMLSDDEIMEFE
jgi:A118 family predicted phage portal protein